MRGTTLEGMVATALRAHLLAGLPVGKFPLITAHMSELVARDVDERSRFAIDTVLDGVLARGPRNPTGN